MENSDEIMLMFERDLNSKLIIEKLFAKSGQTISKDIL